MHLASFGARSMREKQRFSEFFTFVTRNNHVVKDKAQISTPNTVCTKTSRALVDTNFLVMR